MNRVVQDQLTGANPRTRPSWLCMSREGLIVTPDNSRRFLLSESLEELNPYNNSEKFLNIMETAVSEILKLIGFTRDVLEWRREISYMTRRTKDDESADHEEQHQHFHVLAVDDSALDRKLLERLLKVSSYQVTFVECGEKVLEYLELDNLEDITAPSSPSSSSFNISQPTQQEEMKVNLIMTDYSMPGMSGYDLLKRIQSSSWKDVPVVVMSSENIPSRITMCLEGGAEEFLLKPLQLSDVKKLQPRFLKTQIDVDTINGSNTKINNISKEKGDVSNLLREDLK
ncbi:two-component response regulator ORR9-like [Mercurialis annua]|uniref:two-component response regulator ORR9-like n=1 Tax=Mercurialis annua TaxID=3986 RepID=UPI0024AFB846|nr:two-component response regulator ORR9-like [Mercurialis annua]